MKSLIKTLLAVVIVTAPAFTFAKPPITINNIADVSDRHLSGFNAVELGGSFDVYITQGSTESVKVEAPSDVMNHIITEVSGGVLKIYNKHDSWHWGNWWGNHKKIVVYVSAKALNAVSISGSGDVFFKEGLSGNSLKLRISGSGDMLGKVSVKNLESSISGSGDMKLSGNADSSTVSVVGSGDFTARNLVTVNSAVRVSGSGDADINASDKIDAAVIGSGDVRYTGSAKNISKSKTGSGDISRL
jgi:hypothetical protein